MTIRSGYVALLTHRLVSHVDLVLPDGNLLGASNSPKAPIIKTLPPGDPAGVAVRPPDYQEFNVRRNAILRTVEDKAIAFLNFCWAQLGKPFDNGALRPSVFLSANFHDRDWRTPDEWYCAELMTRALEVSGILNWPILAVKNRITSADLLLIVNPLIDVQQFRKELPDEGLP